MHNEVFQHANLVFKGHLHKSKQEGNDVSQPRSDIAQEDLNKLYNEYFIPGLAAGNTEILMHKVFYHVLHWEMWKRRFMCIKQGFPST